MNGHRQTAEVVALVLLFLGITLLTVVGFASKDWMPPVASQHGVGVDEVIRYLLLTTGAVLVICTLVMVGFLWQYGRGRPAHSPQTSPGAERWWSLVPVLGMAMIAEVGVLAKGLPVWKQVYGPPPSDALVIEVIAQQFEWIVRYPGEDGKFGRTDPTLVDGEANPAGLDANDPAAMDDVVARRAMHLPTGRTVYLRLRSRDVLHSFSIPAFRVKQDVVPGIISGTQFVPTRPGRYEIACAELCGMAHYKMGGRVVVHSPEEYTQWLSEQVGFFQ